MNILIPFLFSFFWSFAGSIPPATINLTVVQLGVEGKMNLAWRLALGAALIEYPYAWIAIKLENIITSSPMVVANFRLIAAVVMTTLGLLNLWSAKKPSKFIQKFNDTGFRRGLILGILNPLAMPFWIGITAYLESQNLIELSTNLQVRSYLVGVSLGGFTLLILLAYLAKKIATDFRHNAIIKIIPGALMLVMGVFSFAQYLFHLLN